MTTFSTTRYFAASPATLFEAIRNPATPNASSAGGGRWVSATASTPSTSSPAANGAST